MKKDVWKELLSQHQFFSNINSEEKKELIDWLLGGNVSEERHFSAGSVILNEGEFGESIFLIGSGSVRAVLMGKLGEVTTELSIMKKGEFFGEIGILQDEPRSATVVANQDCTVLEIKGDEFLDLLHNHPDIEIKVLFKLCERLRHTHDQFLAKKLISLDEKLHLFKAKLDAELKVFDAELKACQTVFDQTKMRTDEVIYSSERSRTRMTIAASVIGTFVTIVIGLFGFIGVKQLMSLDRLMERVENHKDEIEEHKTKIEGYKNSIKLANDEINASMDSIKESKIEVQTLRDELHENTGSLYDSIEMANNYILENTLIPGLENALKTNGIADQRVLYQKIKSLKPEDVFYFVERFRFYIVKQITSQKAEGPGDYTEFLQVIREDASTPKQTFMCYYTLLANAILVDKEETFESSFEDFKQFIKKYRGEKISEDEIEISMLHDFFSEQNQKKQDKFESINSLILEG